MSSLIQSHLRPPRPRSCLCSNLAPHGDHAQAASPAQERLFRKNDDANTSTSLLCQRQCVWLTGRNNSSNSSHLWSAL